MTLHHIGIVTTEPDKYARIFESYGGKIIDSGVASEFGVECFFVDMGNITIELITPLEDNKINKYMNESKTSLHHIAVNVNKLENPKNGACGLKVDFKLNDKLLIEEVQQ